MELRFEPMPIEGTTDLRGAFWILFTFIIQIKVPSDSE